MQLLIIHIYKSKVGTVGTGYGVQVRGLKINIPKGNY